MTSGQGFDHSRSENCLPHTLWMCDDRVIANSISDTGRSPMSGTMWLKASSSHGRRAGRHGSGMTSPTSQAQPSSPKVGPSISELGLFPSLIEFFPTVETPILEEHMPIRCLRLRLRLRRSL